MNILYLTWGETPRTYGVFSSQVVKQLVAIKELLDDCKIDLLSALPIIHSGLIRERARYFQEIICLREALRDIPLHILPIFSPQNFIFSSKETFRFIHGFNHFTFAKHLNFYKPDIVHCRSYHATWAAVRTRQRYNFSYKVICDARGRWPEELALKNRWSVSNQNYKYWKHIEKFIIKESDVIVSLSRPMSNFLRKERARKVVEIYTSAPVFRAAKKPSLSPPPYQEHSILCYVGALSSSTWHTPQSLLKLYNKYRECVKKPKLLIITTSDHQFIFKSLQTIPKNELEVTSTKTSKDLYQFLSTASYGALPFQQFSQLQKMKKEVGSTIVGTKTAEYLAAGLPVLVNKACVAAAEMVTQWEIGISYSPETLKEINPQSLQRLRANNTVLRAKMFAERHFSYESNAQKYIALYKKTLQRMD